jgi:hypothetical protein
MNDAGSLQNLNDIVLPGPAAWWPLAPGWYVLAAAVSLVLAVLAARWWRRRRRNRYRRQALLELSSLRERATADSSRQVPALLKRTALSAWPRESVASLNGAAWHGFLDESAAMEEFGAGAGVTLDCLAYGGNEPPLPADEDLKQLFEAAGFWLKNHVVPEQEV